MIKQIMISNILVLLVATKGDAAVAACDNAATAGVLCELLALGGVRSLLTQPKPGYDTAHHEILDLNMSLAGESWRSVFEDPKNKGTYPETKPEKFTANKDWDKRWKEWAQTAARLKDNNGIQNNLKEHKLHPRSVQHLSIAKQAILQLANEQSALATQLQRIKADNKILNNERLREKINTALYGENPALEATLTQGAAFEGAAAASRAGNCDGTAKDNKAKTVMAALVCICAKDNSNPLDKVCATHQALSSTWTPNAYPANSVMQEIRKLCPKSKPALLTASRLRQLISAVKSHLTGGSAGITLGKLDTGSDCSGSDNSGLCVKYTDIHDGGSATADDINWIAALNQIADDISSHEEAVATVDRIAEQLADNNAKAKDFIANLEQYTQAQAAVSTAANPKAAQAQENDQKAKNDCGIHSSNQTCTAHKTCKWEGKNETDGKCEVDETKVTRKSNSARIGETANTEGKKCSEKKTEGNCKDGCKWENNACKDSSFLVHKKLALSMATFFGFAFF
uniref:Variant surface glycoprotein 1125.188 n=1 Tax=Trypanosoma brucei TaxID=5691 RepID=A0A1J0R5C8_9TRYP|nr:variant surface glycoprotein 1125.188 [Trypanosoma brucei]